MADLTATVDNHIAEQSISTDQNTIKKSCASASGFNADKQKSMKTTTNANDEEKQQEISPSFANNCKKSKRRHIQESIVSGYIHQTISSVEIPMDVISVCTSFYDH